MKTAHEILAEEFHPLKNEECGPLAHEIAIGFTAWTHKRGWTIATTDGSGHNTYINLLDETEETESNLFTLYLTETYGKKD